MSHYNWRILECIFKELEIYGSNNLTLRGFNFPAIQSEKSFEFAAAPSEAELCWEVALMLWQISGAGEAQ